MRLRRVRGEALSDLRPFVEDPDFVLYCGDAREVLASLPDESVDCAATSPPFYGLRDYGTGSWKGGNPDCDHAVRTEAIREKQLASTTLGGGTKTVGHQYEGYKDLCPRCGARRTDRQIGLEATPEEWAAELVSVFREVRRTLKPHGTLWVECGDSYASNGTSASGGNRTETRPDGMSGSFKVTTSSLRERGAVGAKKRRPADLKPKDLLGQPWLLAFALRADGWWLRQAIIWHKPNAMPESATDRCTTAHSYVFLLSKQARYFFDAEAIGEDFSPNTNSRGKGYGVKQTLEERSGTKTAGRGNASWGAATQADLAPHLVRPPQAETLGDLEGETPRGADGRRVTHVKQGPCSLQHRDGNRWPNEQKNPRSVWTIPTQGYPDVHFATWPEALVERILKAGCPEGGTVLDPFMGSGTTALVARKLGRRSVGIELNEEYAKLAARRLSQLSLLA